MATSAPQQNPADEETLRPSERRNSSGHPSLQQITLPDNLSVHPQDLSTDKLLSTTPKLSVAGDQLPVPSLGGIPLLSKLGQGGMGAVYYGIHPRLDVEVAVKVLPFDLAEKQPDMIERFFREAKVAAKVKSPNLVGVLDVNEECGLYYIVMEFVPGMSAGAYLKQCVKAGATGISESEVLDICIAACKGVAVAHEMGVIHRDLKPDNIMIPRSNEVLTFGDAKVVDLGLARNEEVDQSLTGNQQAMGTPGYMAPEQGLDAKTAGKPADVFSLGATLYALLSGQAPFAGTSVMKILIDTAQTEHPALGPLRPDVSRATLNLIDQCLAKSPQQRLPDAIELLKALVACRTGLPESEVPQGNGSGSLKAERATEPVMADTILSSGVSPKTVVNVTSQDSLVPTLVTKAPAAMEKGKDQKLPEAAGSKTGVILGLTVAVVVVVGLVVFGQRKNGDPQELPSGNSEVQAAAESKDSAPVDDVKKDERKSIPRAVEPSEAEAAGTTALEAPVTEVLPIKPEKIEPQEEKKPPTIEEATARLAKLVASAKAGDLKAGAEMIDLLMFDEMGSFSKGELNGLAKWKTAGDWVGEKHSVQILAVFMAHQTIRQRRMLPIVRKARLLLVRGLLESKPLSDPVLLSQMAWLLRTYEPIKLPKAERYVKKALILLNKEDPQKLSDLTKATRLMVKGSCLLPTRNPQGDWDEALKALQLAEIELKRLRYSTLSASCLKLQEKVKRLKANAD